MWELLAEGLNHPGVGGHFVSHMRNLAEAGATALEMDRPDRSDRRRQGKDGDLDAINAARVAGTNQRATIPKSKDVAV